MDAGLTEPTPPPRRRGILPGTPRYPRPVSIVEWIRAVVEGGGTSLGSLALLPVGIGGGAAWLHARGDRRGSQWVANLGIAVALGVVLVTACSMVWARAHGIDLLADVGVAWFLVPAWMVVAAVWIEARLHPGRQEALRRPVRRAMGIVVVLALLYWLLSTMRVWMMVHTGVLGLLLFLAAVAGLLYVLVRRAV